jgi:hypothetical protein
MSSKTGDVLTCTECGLEVTVTKACGCGEQDCAIVCCEKPMKPKQEKPRAGGCCCGGK